MNKLLVIVGPTGTGKTDLALKLAKKFNGELVSSDSRQVYIGMDIGTGKEQEEEKSKKAKGKNTKIQKEEGKWIVDGVPIYLYDIINPDKRFSLAEYQQLALEKIKEIHSKGKLPILVGGTGLYIQAVTEGLKIPKAPPDQKFREQTEKEPLPKLLEQLEKIDPKTFEKIDKNNKRRVIRALEVFKQSGETFSSLQEKYIKVGFDVLKVGLTSDRETLYSQNDIRVENWFKIGFADEVKNLIIKFDVNLPSLTSLGYRQVAMFLEEKLSLEEAKQRIKFEIHGYIRRQLTWFKRDSSIYWYELNMQKKEFEVESLVEEWLEHKPT